MSSFYAWGTKSKRFCLRINIPKRNCWILRIDVVASCQKLAMILLIKWFKNWRYQNMPITENLLIDWYYFMKKNKKNWDDFWNRKLTLKVKFWHLLTPPHYTNFQNSIIFFRYVCWFLGKNLSNWKLENPYYHKNSCR